MRKSSLKKIVSLVLVLATIVGFAGSSVKESLCLNSINMGYVREEESFIDKDPDYAWLIIQKFVTNGEGCNKEIVYQFLKDGYLWEGIDYLMKYCKLDPAKVYGPLSRFSTN